MKHYLDLVPISAKVHRKQSRMSIFCIVLAVFLVTTIFGMADMFVRSQIIKTQAETGNWHIALRNISDEDAAVIAARSDIEAVVAYDVLNFRGDQGYTLNGTETLICGSDEGLFTKILSDIIAEGNFPQNDNEAMVSVNAKEMIGLSIGDQIAVNLPDGTELAFTISGFVENTANLMSSDSYGVFITTEKYRTITSTAADSEPSENNTFFYVQFSNTGNIQNKISELKSQFGLSNEQVSENTKLLGLLGQSSDSFMVQVYISAAVLFVLVLFAGTMMIASSLNSNVAQRTEFFGLMRCIGATPKQVMRLVRKEALSWCRFAIPVGVLSGMVVIWILCFILRLLSPEFFGEMPAFSISVPSIVAGIIVGLLTVLLAARSPAKRASRVSPLAAVSGNANDLQPIRKAANTKCLKVDTALGIHHAKASRKNFVLTVCSFALSIVLFLAFSVTITFMNHTLTPLYPWAPDLSIVSSDNSCSVDRAFIDDLKENPAVDAVYGRMFAYNVPVTVNGAEKTAILVSYEQQQFEWASDYLQSGSLETVESELNTGLTVYDTQNSMQVGDTVTMEIGGQPAEIQITGILSTSPFNNTGDSGIIIVSEDTFRQITGEENYTIIDMQLSSNATDEDVNAIHRSYGAGFDFVDKRMDNSSTLGVYYCVWLFLYGFLALIALITVFNVINSIALSVSARTKQYGAFRAIGLSIRQLSRMIIAEAATYAITGCIIGTSLGLICNKVLFDLLINFKWGEPWTIPWGEIGIIVLIMIISVIWAVYRPLKELQKMSIVDTIIMTY